jgi:isoquinoline 1-oxidoreductase alpha subunit
LNIRFPSAAIARPGMIMSAAALLAKHPNPTDPQIDATMTNLCRCGTYARVRKAIHALSDVPGGDAAARV